MTSEKSVALALNTLKLLAHPVRLGILCQLIEQGKHRRGKLWRSKRRGQVSRKHRNIYVLCVKRGGCRHGATGSLCFIRL